MRRFALVLLVLALTGCGSGGGKGGPTGTEPTDVAANQRGLDKQIAYDIGVNTCSQYTLKQAADIYGVKPEAEAIADAVAKDAEDRELREQTRKGCLAAYE